MEGVFARGDRRLAPVIVRAVELGCRFDGWGDHFSLVRWQQAFTECGIQPEWYLRRRELEEILPWDHLDCGVTQDFLLKERAQALNEAATSDCRHGDCSACGVCDFSTLTNRISDAGELPAREVRIAQDILPARMRLRFGKSGAMRYLSHLELLTVFTRAVSKAGVPILFSQGFHPHPRFSFATATSVGVESVAEYIDMFVEDGIPAEEVQRKLNTVFPEGLKILEAVQVDIKAASLSTLIDKTRYRITFNGIDPEHLSELCAQFMAHTELVIHRKKKGEVQSLDLRGEVTALNVTGLTINMVAGRGKPIEFARAILRNDTLQADEIRIEKLEVIFNSGAEQ
jgi:radical SAM-linked protein